MILANVEGTRDFDNLLVFIADNSQEAADFPAIVALLPASMQSPEFFIKALKSGVSGILPPDASAEEIAATVAAAAAGLLNFTPEAADELLSLFDENDALRTAAENERRSFQNEMIEALMPREAEILEMRAEGASNKSIAVRLSISEHTVKFHVASIFGKLGVNTRTEAVTQAWRSGLLLL